MKIKNAIISILCSVVCFVPLLSFSGCSGTVVFKIGNYEDYIDSDVVDEFVDYYYQTFNERISIRYITYDNCDNMFTKIKRSKMDYDVVMAQEYIVDKLSANNLLQKLDFANIPNKDNVDVSVARLDKNLKDYYIAYTWGTVGILYNSTMVDPSAVTSWAALWDDSNPELRRMVYMKDSIRESTAVALAYSHREELMKRFGTPSHSEYWSNLLWDFSSENFSLIESALTAQKPFLKGYETDNGKDELIRGSAAMGVAWSGDALWSMTENTDLRYYVPHEGSTTFTDSWVVPKYAKNKLVAERFIDYMLIPENAARCMDYVYFTSANKLGQELYLTDYLGLDDDLIANKDFSSLDELLPDTDAEYRQMFVESMFPPKDVIARCAVPKDFGSSINDVLKMWARVMIA